MMQPREGLPEGMVPINDVNFGYVVDIITESHYDPELYNAILESFDEWGRVQLILNVTASIMARSYK